MSSPLKTLTKEEEKQRLLARLQELDSDDTPIIQSPMDDIVRKAHESFTEGQQVAFINDRIDVVSAIIDKINPDDSYNLRVLVPKQRTKVKFNTSKSTFTRKATTELVEELRLQVHPGDPRTIFVKNVVALAQAQQGSGDGCAQTHINEYIDSGNRVRTPRFHDFHTSIIGKFFDPSIYVYKVHCWRSEKVIDKEKIPEERLYYPKKQPYFLNFAEAFQRFFKEYHQGMSKSGNKWNIVEIIPTLKVDIK